jgi:predicted dehydrogenase/nucleoside-diphosphate-sugar epimerase
MSRQSLALKQRLSLVSSDVISLTDSMHIHSNNKWQARLRIGIVGCGKVAEHHARFIKALPTAQLSAIADVNEEAARRFAERHGIPNVRATIDDLLDSTALDVLHVITPPAYHYECAKAALDCGMHVFVEKPVAFTVREVTDLYERAAARGVLLCPDFLQLFHPKVQELLALIDSKQLGRVVHVESYLCLNPDDSPELLEAEGIHWIYRLPGGPLRDYTSHLLSLALYFAGWPNNIQVSRNSRGTLPQGLVDHLTVKVDGTRSTATILLSCLARPSAYGLRVLCERGSAEVNFDTHTLLVHHQTSLPRRIVSATASFTDACRLSVQAVGNIISYIRGKLVPYGGMQVLISHFYDSILHMKPPPISRELATAVTRAEEAIFSGLTSPCFTGRYCPSVQTTIRHVDRVLVTGANGYVGWQVVQTLVGQGYYVRALVRPTSSPERLQQLGVEVFLGDVRRLEDVSAAANSMQVIIHLAAGLKGSQAFIVDTCVHGTQNVAEATALQHVKRVIYMSSCSVYDFAKLHDGEDITETSPLEEQPESRGAYSLGKRRAEEVALSHLADSTTPWTILRPALIVGQGRDIFAPVGAKIGNTLVCLGRPRKCLLLVHVEDVAAAVLQLLQNNQTQGQVYILSHRPITVREYVDTCIRRSRYRDVRVLYVPYFLARLGGWMATLVQRLTHLGPSINRRRLLSVYREVGINSTLLLQHTGWQPMGALLTRLHADQIDGDHQAPAG